MNYDTAVIAKHQVDLLRENIFKLCQQKPMVSTALCEALNMSKGKIKTAVDYLEKHSFIICTKVMNHKKHKWENNYTAGVRPFRCKDISEMQKERDIVTKGNKDDGKYDALIRSNKNLSVYRLTDKARPFKQGSRKSQKFVGIGSSFAMFNGA